MAKEGEFIPRVDKSTRTQHKALTLKDLVAVKDFGELPHELLLRVSRGERIQHGTDENDSPRFIQPTFDERLECAKVAAPYFAPKLATVEFTKGLSEYELDTLITELATEAGAFVTFTGEGEEGETTPSPKREPTDRTPEPSTTERPASRRRVILSDDARTPTT